MINWLKRYVKKRKARWESLCKGCGLCCYEKEGTELGRVVIDLNKPCRYLNEQNMTCTIYSNRFKKSKGKCKKVTIFHALFVNYMPETCGYVEKYRPWRKWCNYPVYRN